MRFDNEVRLAFLPTAALLCAIVTGCATAPDAGERIDARSGCVDGSFSGRYTPAVPSEPERRLKIAARSCDGDALHVEVRGAVGGPVLVATVQGGRMTLLLPRERRAVEGPAGDRRLWEAQTGLPFDGGLLRELLTPAPGSGRAIGDWRFELSVDPGARFPGSLAAVHAGGSSLTIEKRRERPARAEIPTTVVPDDFELLSYDP